MLYANNLIVLVLFLILFLYFDIQGGFCVRQQHSLPAESVMVSAVRSQLLQLSETIPLCSTFSPGTGIRAHATCSVDDSLHMHCVSALTATVFVARTLQQQEHLKITSQVTAMIPLCEGIAR
jgi:hypothetical protein